MSDLEHGDGETSGDPVHLFGRDLSRLRLRAENPTLARLQAETGISRTVLSEAFNGAKLPTARTVDGIVRACGEDPGPWLDRRDALAARGKENGGETPVSASSTTAVSRRTAVLLATGTFLAGVAASAVTTTLIVANATTASPNAPQITVSNGVDPAMTACVDDARVATGDTRADNSLLEIVWSDKCQAGWGRITRYDGLGQDNTVTIAIYPETAPDGPGRQEATEHDVQGAYTTLVVRPSPDTLLCAEGSFTVDGERIDLGDPLCI
ncbi:DUF2690 domain-containing protein [Microbacterium sp. ET2]|uniref:DUF2690 domain-containing protein n=1 Tax=Microbacterium albipurpureum TaxID=3050384 RepID=UPI00259CAF9E|nr:DUF2690 domain-containing protein [Microbacterium sp. ET2 (Ac-2212)]WJL94717.1 DUF2690 domain-containing protein [Microbacterium sp. ET2 (Ac-2212)]